jgi:quercetin dioxygenase-like cupin family protein
LSTDANSEQDSGSAAATTPESALPAPIRALPSITGAVTGPLAAIHRLSADGCDVIFAAFTAGVEVPPHHHDTENATVMVSGQALLTTDEGERRIGPGEWYQTSPGQTHALRFEADTVQIELRFATSPQPG